MPYEFTQVFQKYMITFENDEQKKKFRDMHLFIDRQCNWYPIKTDEYRAWMTVRTFLERLILHAQSCTARTAVDALVTYCLLLYETEEKRAEYYHFVYLSVFKGFIEDISVKAYYFRLYRYIYALTLQDKTIAYHMKIQKIFDEHTYYSYAKINNSGSRLVRMKKETTVKSILKSIKEEIDKATLGNEENMEESLEESLKACIDAIRLYVRRMRAKNLPEYKTLEVLWVSNNVKRVN